jgi:hypothetical protein
MDMTENSLKNIFFRISLIAYVSLYSLNLVADSCASVGNGPEEFILEDGTRIGALESVERARCRALTDRTKNNGKPLTIQQPEMARGELLRPYKPDTLFGNLERSSVNRIVDCMIASADIKVCMCLSDTLPAYLSYSQYLGLLYASRSISAQNLGVDETELRQLTGAAWAARDQCLVTPPDRTR